MTKFNLYDTYQNSMNEDELVNFIKTIFSVNKNKLNRQLDSIQNSHANLFCIFDTAIVGPNAGNHDRYYNRNVKRSPIAKSRKGLESVIQTYLFPANQFKVTILINKKRGNIVRIRILLDRKKPNSMIPLSSGSLFRKPGSITNRYIQA